MSELANLGRLRRPVLDLGGHPRLLGRDGAVMIEVRPVEMRQRRIDELRARDAAAVRLVYGRELRIDDRPALRRRRAALGLDDRRQRGVIFCERQYAVMIGIALVEHEFRAPLHVDPVHGRGIGERRAGAGDHRQQHPASRHP